MTSQALSERSQAMSLPWYPYGIMGSFGFLDENGRDRSIAAYDSRIPGRVSMAREGAASFQESYGQGPKARDKNWAGKRDKRGEAVRPQGGAARKRMRFKFGLCPFTPPTGRGLRGTLRPLWRE